MKVTVTQGIQVVHAGQVYRNGASADVPDAVGQRWVRNGWASEDGRSSLPDPRGLNKTNAVASADTEPDAGSLGVPDVEANVPTHDDEPESAEPVKPKAKATGRARRRDPRRKADNDDE